MNDLKDGVHPGLTFDAYARLDAVNNSLLRHFERSPAHAREHMLHPPESTEAQAIGVAAHAAILEPEKFRAGFCQAPDLDRRTRAGKDAWGAFEREHAGQTVLAAAELALCERLAAAVQAHPLASVLVNGKGSNELTAVWTDEATGLRCKGRIDRFTAFMGWTVVLDLKTTANGSPKDFPRSVAKYGYARQAAFYLDGLQRLAPAQRRFFTLALEKEPPYCVTVFELDDGALEQGRREYRRFLERFAWCKKNNQWLGYSEGLEPLALPAWALEKLEEVEA